MSGTPRVHWWRACATLVAPGLLALAGQVSANPPLPTSTGAPLALPGLTRPAQAPQRLPTLQPAPGGHTVAAPATAAPPGGAPANATPAAPVAPARPVVTLGLEEARAQARALQPAIAAARSTLAVAEARFQAVKNIRVPALVARELPHRRNQSAIGVQVASAGVHLAEINTDYGVHFGYLTYLFARSQQQVTEEGVANLTRLRKTVKTILDEGTRGDIVTRDLNTIDTYIALVQGKNVEARKGSERALSALREAIGLPCETTVALKQDRLLLVKAPSITRDQVVALALARRPEVTQANLGVDVTALEVCAQDKHTLTPTAPTFASGSDLHANPLPAGSYDFDYKPGAIGPEMPTTLNGSRKSRVEQATIYLDRSRSVAEKAKNLIRLEAEQAYLRFAEARDKLPKYEEAYKQASAAFEDVKKKFTAENMNVKLDQFLNAALLATQMRVQVNEARYQMLLGLALIERVTAGGLPAGLGSAPQEKDAE